MRIAVCLTARQQNPGLKMNPKRKCKKKGSAVYGQSSRGCRESILLDSHIKMSNPPAKKEPC